MRRPWRFGGRSLTIAMVLPLSPLPPLRLLPLRLLRLLLLLLLLRRQLRLLQLGASLETPLELGDLPPQRCVILAQQRSPSVDIAAALRWRAWHWSDVLSPRGGRDRQHQRPEERTSGQSHPPPSTMHRTMAQQVRKRLCGAGSSAAVRPTTDRPVWASNRID